MIRTAHRRWLGVAFTAASLAGVTALSACSSDPSDGWKQLEGRGITVEGAGTALIQTLTYKDGGEQAEGAWIIASQRQLSASVVVSIGGTEVDQALVTHVMDTLRYEHSDEPAEDDA